MSIYSTLWTLKFPIYGDDHTGCDWIEVFAQGVPAHVGLDESYPEDPYADFLPAEVAQWTAGYGHLVLLGGAERWKNNVLAKPGAEERVAKIRAELLRAGVTEVGVRSIAPAGAVDEPS